MILLAAFVITEAVEQTVLGEHLSNLLLRVPGQRERWLMCTVGYPGFCPDYGSPATRLSFVVCSVGKNYSFTANNIYNINILIRSKKNVGKNYSFTAINQKFGNA